MDEILWFCLQRIKVGTGRSNLQIPLDSHRIRILKNPSHLHPKQMNIYAFNFITATATSVIESIDRIDSSWDSYPEREKSENVCYGCRKTSLNYTVIF
jgi:hypothetical protein